jgi:hypothetical protein
MLKNKFKNFFFKKPEIVLDCFTTSSFVYDYAKVNYGHRYMPQWFKDTPLINQDGEPTIKHCTGVKDFYKTGIVIPSWFEMRLHIFKKDNDDRSWYEWIASNEQVKCDGSHSPEQFEGYALDNGTNLKLDTPWLFRTNKYVQFAWTQPTWSQRSLIDNLTVLPAVVDYKYQHDTNISFFVLNKDEPKDVTIEALTPLVILHPMTDVNVVIKNHLVDRKEYDRINGIDKLFVKDGKTETRRWLARKKTMDKIEKIECPYKGKTK